MAKAKRFDVFLSYSSLDQAWVARLKGELESHGIRVWLDRNQIRPGDKFLKALEKGIEASDSMAMVVSPGSLDSGWVEEEYSRAMSLAVNGRLRIIPVLLEGCKMPGFLTTRNWVDFRKKSSFEQSLSHLIWGITGEQIVEKAVRGNWVSTLVQNLRRRRSSCVLMIGSTGAGKTLLLDSLTETIRKGIPRVNRTRHMEKRNLQIANEPFAFHDIPGESIFRTCGFRQDVLRAVSQGHVGVIDVVSFGYHEYGTVAPREALTKAGLPRRRFLTDHQSYEIGESETWGPTLAALGLVDWWITAITKADLWWNDRDEVVDHYVSGAYAVALETFCDVPWRVVEYCAVSDPFFGVAPGSSRFPRGKSQQCHSDLFKTILELSGQEGT